MYYLHVLDTFEKIDDDFKTFPWPPMPATPPMPLPGGPNNKRVDEGEIGI